MKRWDYVEIHDEDRSGEFYRVEDVQALCREVLPFVSTTGSKNFEEFNLALKLQEKLKAIVEAKP